jgi:WD40 repeat protein
MQTCAAPNHRGDNIAFIRETFLGLHDVRSGRVQLKNAGPTLHTIKPKTLKWSDDDSRILILGENGIKVENVGRHPGTIADLDNGSGGFGQIVAADFVGKDEIVVVWEFGKTRVCHLRSGKHVELADAKMTGNGQVRALRPMAKENRSADLLVMLSRSGAEDTLARYFAGTAQPQVPIKLSATDAQSLSWSPDGRWLAVLDVPSSSPSIHIYTPDGHLFRSCSSPNSENGELGSKSLSWSPNGQILALAKHDNTIELVNTKTFTLVAVLHHPTSVDQKALPSDQQVPIWQESVSAANVRTFSLMPHPVMPPLSKARLSTEPDELGISDLCFSCDGSYIASRDNRMLNTVWLWKVGTYALHAVLILHNNARKLLWHPTRTQTLMIDCGESIVHIFELSSESGPHVVPTESKPKAALTWLRTQPDSKAIIIATEKQKFTLVYPESRDDHAATLSPNDELNNLEDSFYEDDGVEDSLLEILSGRKPMHPKTKPSYTEMVDDLVAEAATSEELDDTFREKKQQKANAEAEFDPLDDSQIF